MKRIVLALLGALAWGSTSLSQAAGPAPAAGPTAKAILAGGCFWCVEHDFRQLPGVVNVVSGYSGGSRDNPTYENHHDVSAATPVPHVEVVEVTYDTTKLTYEKVLDYFVRHIDPTDGGGQFCDRGASYVPVIYPSNAAEKATATAKLAEVEKVLKMKVAVGIVDAAKFWPAEDYHQDYATKNPIRYKYYRAACGRDQRVGKVWQGVSH